MLHRSLLPGCLRDVCYRPISDTFWRSMKPATSQALTKPSPWPALAARLPCCWSTPSTARSRPKRPRRARVLRAAGYALHTPGKGGGHHCSGRTVLACGRVDEAKARAVALIDALLPLARAGVAIAGLEPSFLLTLRDEALVMGMGDTAQTVAEQALLFEEFVDRESGPGARSWRSSRCVADPRARPLPVERLRRREPDPRCAAPDSTRDRP